MDYVFWSSIRGHQFECLTVSYDISCQWKIHLWDRLQLLPSELQVPRNSIRMHFGLPVFHAPVHKADCHDENTLRHLDGVGMTDGEGVERVWSDFNPLAASTKEMGPGNRHDAVDNHAGFRNWEKNTGLHK